MVEREKNLNPLLNIKNIIKSEPSKSLPISIITQQKDFLKVPTRPIEFIRKFPSIFQEFLPGGIGIQPHIKLTPEVLNLDAEEQLVYQSDSYKQDLADRLLKLLMISRINKIPLRILDMLKWDLGLPQDYIKTLVPEFPDYFRVVSGEGFSSGSEDTGELELVCWSNELSVSVLEKKATKGEMGYSKGMPIAFPMKFSRGFEMDKKVKKWVDEWQKLPYISPYENAGHLSPKSDESDRWAAAVLHEIMNLFVARKVERENVFCLGDYMGIRSRFKRVLLHHPGIFYLSSKFGSYTVVLREVYKRGLLIESNPLLGIRSQYIHLMNTVKENNKAITVPSGSKQKEKGAIKDDECHDDSADNNSAESGSEVEDFSDDDYEDNDEDEDEDGADRKQGQRGFHRNPVDGRGRTSRQKDLDLKRHAGNVQGERTTGKYDRKTVHRRPLKASRRKEVHGGHSLRQSSKEWSKSTQSKRRSLWSKETST